LLPYIARRLIQAVLVLLAVSFIVFILLHITGDPVALMLPPDATYEEIESFRQQLGLNDPLYVQYGRFLTGLLQGDFGTSIRSRQPALGLVLERLPATLELAFAAMVLAVVVAFPVGIISAVRRGSVLDHIGMVLALVGQSVPVFWLGIMLILVFAVNLGLVPPAGRGSLSALILPAITLGLFSMARTARLVRSSMLEVLTQNYITTARAKGLAEFVITYRHALKNALIPVITVLGLDFATLLGGAVITETIFAWPGVGRLVVTSIAGRDYPVVQAAVFIIASSYTLLNLFVDILYAYLDPRIRFA
jgi:peptide/nickel transport system permease protein